jgi:hypothetical protein
MRAPSEKSALACALARGKRALLTSVRMQTGRDKITGFPGSASCLCLCRPLDACSGAVPCFATRSPLPASLSAPRLPPRPPPTSPLAASLPAPRSLPHSPLAVGVRVRAPAYMCRCRCRCVGRGAGRAVRWGFKSGDSSRASWVV